MERLLEILEMGEAGQMETVIAMPRFPDIELADLCKRILAMPDASQLHIRERLAHLVEAVEAYEKQLIEEGTAINQHLQETQHSLRGNLAYLKIAATARPSGQE